MLHPSVIRRNIDRLERKYSIQLEEHSTIECARVYEHFLSITQGEGRKRFLSRNPVTDPDGGKFVHADWERDWIRNEMYLCACSFPYWFYRYFFIKTKEGRIQRPDVLIAQQIFLDILSELDAKGLPILLLILKARQLGMSTITEAIVLWIALFRRGSHCVIASAEEEKSEEMSQMVWIGLDNLPVWMSPRLVRDDAKKGPGFAHDSDILLQHGAQSKGISRGSTPVAAHLCLAPNTLIQCADGRLIPLRESKGRVTLTHSGQITQVENTWKSERTNELGSQIWVHGNFSPLECTRDHQIMMADGEWEEAGSIQCGDWLHRPVRAIVNKPPSAILPDSPIRKRASNKCKLKELRLTPEIGYVLGLYLAEGSVLYNRARNQEWPSGIQFTIHRSEIERTERALAGALEMKSVSRKRTTSLTAMTIVYWSAFARWVEQQFGSGDGKRVPFWVWSCGQDFCYNLVRGYLDGDGHYVPEKNEIYASSIRVSILVSLRELLASLGCGWSSLHYRPAGTYYKRDCREQWTICVAGATGESFRKMARLPTYNLERSSDHWRWGKGKTSIHVQVETVGDCWLPEVWDIEVGDPDHSFLTPVGIAKNSEVAYYPNPVETIESSLIRAMHENPRTFLVLETTARKKGDWFHHTWLANRAGEVTGYNRFMCMFLPWYVGKDKYPTKDWLRNHPIPEAWVPMRETVRQAGDARLYVKSTPMLRKYLGMQWAMPLEQMWFWEFNYIEAKREDATLKAFLAEMAADERSCFQSKKFSVYQLDVIKRIEETSEKAEYVDYALIGDGVDTRFHLKDYWSPTGRRVDIVWQTNQGQARAWKLVPLREAPTADELRFYIRIWQLPRREYDYTIGIDISGGLGADNTSFDVLRTNPKDKQQRDVQVAQLYSPWISSPEAPPFALALGILYGKHMSPIPQAKVAPEVQVATGDPISYQLDKEGYVNFHYMKRYDLVLRAGAQRHRRGWASLGWSRQMMRETLKHAIDNNWVEVNSVNTANEMANEEGDETDTGKTRYDHSSDSNDDSITSLGIAYMSSHDETTIMERIQGKVRPRKRDEDEEAERKRNAVPPDAVEVMLQRHFRHEDEEGIEELGIREGEYGDAGIY